MQEEEIKSINNAIKRAVKKKNVPELRKLVDSIELSNIRVPFHIAVNTDDQWFPLKGYVDMIEILGDKGLDVNIKRNGKPPLNLIASKGQGTGYLEVYAYIGVYLLLHGADVKLLDNKGKSALFHALTGCNEPNFVEALIDAGSDVNLVVPNNGQYTSPCDISILGQAYWNGHQFFDLLVERGAKMTEDEINYLKSINRPLHPKDYKPEN
ncbi:hypothetical protein [Kordia sp.]|uniref:hypothetical protein n=1 Tax=Kordia sp. TaxID=1965332 RepID=UPI003B5A1EB6